MNSMLALFFATAAFLQQLVVAVGGGARRYSRTLQFIMSMSQDMRLLVFEIKILAI